jgi:hypothetical protein
MATQATRPSVPAWFWIVAVAALLWAAAGCYAYLTEISMDAADLAKLPPAQAETWRAMPIWAKSAYAVAVWAGLAGAIALLMRQRWARELYGLSLVGVLVQFGWAFLGTDTLRSLGLAAAAFPALIIVLGAAMFWFAGWATRRGWLR